nr:adenylate/guanylate cyclase domain-containing protein [Bacteroidota bacterium]
MQTLARTRLRIHRTLRITAAWVFVGALVALFEHNVLDEKGVPSDLRRWLDQRVFNMLVAGLFGGGVYIFLLRDWLRKFPYFTALAIVSAILLPVAATVSIWWPWLWKPDSTVPVLDRILTLRFLGQYLFWTGMMAGTMLMVRLNDQYGSGGISYLSGRYHRPRQEMRVFMFLDMHSSTTIAEQLGHKKYFKLLNELFTDITDPIVYSRGEIYQYVGDEISVSWPLRRGVGRQRCIRCFIDIREKLNKKAAHYEKRYGLVPTFKAGFHYGRVTTGEVGLVKKERIYSGDVVNTAARIQNSCNAHNVDNLLSKQLLDVLHLPAEFKVREIGSIRLRGRKEPISLWTILDQESK